MSHQIPDKNMNHQEIIRNNLCHNPEHFLSYIVVYFITMAKPPPGQLITLTVRGGKARMYTPHPPVILHIHKEQYFLRNHSLKTDQPHILRKSRRDMTSHFYCYFIKKVI